MEGKKAMVEGYISRMLRENAKLTDANERLLSENECPLKEKRAAMKSAISVTVCAVSRNSMTVIDEDSIL